MKHLVESLENGDLKRLVHNELHIDEFKSKLGDDKDIIVLCFKVKSKEPSNDLVSFIEKGYEWVIDADVSSGEMYDGDYIVFVELDRDRKAPERIMELMQDLMNLTHQETDEWRFRYYKDKTEHPLTEEDLAREVPLSSEDYERRYGQRDLDQLRAAAGVPIKTKAPKNDLTDSIRIAAGIL